MSEAITFKFTADCTFDAVDLDDAFRKLAEHFDMLSGTVEGEGLEFMGKMEIKPATPADPH